MGQKRSRAASRAWRILRIALLWARKGGILKCRLMVELNHIKAMHRHSSSVSRRRIDSAAVYGERELSFDETPILRLGMSRPGSLRFKLPCIKPSVVDFDYDFREEIYAGRMSLLESESAKWMRMKEKTAMSETVVLQWEAKERKRETSKIVRFGIN